MKIIVVTLFPELFEPFCRLGVLGRAVSKGLIDIQFVNPRVYAEDKHRTVDDRPFGGGPGMLMKVGPLEKALDQARATLPEAKTIYLSPQGRPLDQGSCQSYSESRELILLAGRYEGVDERLIQSHVDEEVSIGDFVLCGGEIPAMAFIEAVARLKPGVLGHPDSPKEDSFVSGLLDHPHYTRPEFYNGQQVPPVLLSGDHQAIARWRAKQSLGKTWRERPDLLEKIELTREQEELLEEFKRDLSSK